MCASRSSASKRSSSKNCSRARSVGRRIQITAISSNDGLLAMPEPRGSGIKYARNKWNPWQETDMALRYVRPLAHEDWVALVEELKNGPSPEQREAVKKAIRETKRRGLYKFLD